MVAALKIPHVGTSLHKLVSRRSMILKGEVFTEKPSANPTTPMNWLQWGRCEIEIVGAWSAKFVLNLTTTGIILLVRVI